jgi:lipid II:glycine glycyltransferase (peptidoglycan interpeptide bridge formation enzyme)
MKRTAEQQLADLNARIDRLRDRRHATLARENQRTKRAEARQKTEFGEAVFAAGAQGLECEEVCGALALYLKERTEERTTKALSLGKRALAAGQVKKTQAAAA